jgi:hypothetical protein
MLSTALSVLHLSDHACILHMSLSQGGSRDISSVHRVRILSREDEGARLKCMTRDAGITRTQAPQSGVGPSLPHSPSESFNKWSAMLRGHLLKEPHREKVYPCTRDV